jgi:hypothetical protein
MSPKDGPRLLTPSTTRLRGGVLSADGQGEAAAGGEAGRAVIDLLRIGEVGRRVTTRWVRTASDQSPSAAGK